MNSLDPSSYREASSTCLTCTVNRYQNLQLNIETLPLSHLALDIEGTSSVTAKADRWAHHSARYSDDFNYLHPPLTFPFSRNP